ncbi:hypothetical protein N7G274_000890 [Stereocaulon virgatum]|uniref:Uncharacterized protein n=1 Tax=Stereocaulon virgatum TaxID=373712 RepID=A0ABR4AMA1_9LECA
MIEPIGPEAYFAIANVTLGALHEHTDKRQFKQQQKFAKIDSEISTWRTGYSAVCGGSLEDLLVREGLEVDEDGYVILNTEDSTLSQNSSKCYELCWDAWVGLCFEKICYQQQRKTFSNYDHVRHSTETHP